MAYQKKSFGVSVKLCGDGWHMVATIPEEEVDLECKTWREATYAGVVWARMVADRFDELADCMEREIDE